MHFHDSAAVCRLSAMNNLNVTVVVLQVFFNICAYFYSECFLCLNKENLDAISMVLRDVRKT